VARWVVVMCMALLLPVAGVQAAEPTPAKPLPAKAAKRKAKPAKTPPAPKEASPKPLHLGLNALTPKQRPSQWHLENVPAPALDARGNPTGARALAMVGPLNGEQRIEFGVAPLVPSRLPSSLATGTDGVATAPAKRTLVPAAQVYMRYSW